ncbi:MAG: c-type cytochrome [Bacteroidota bacterium]
MIQKSIKTVLFSLFAFLFLALPAGAQDLNLDEGKSLFKNNCATCHNRNMRDNLTGPALGAVRERWESEEDLYSWIRNSQALIATGHPRANELYNEWNQSNMSAFPNLTDQQIANILGYIDGVYEGTYGPAANAAVAGLVPGDNVTVEEGDNTLLFVTLFLILGILAVVLARIIANLNHMNQVKEGNVNAERKTLMEIITSKGVIAFLLFAFVVLAGSTTVNNAINLGRQQGYQPEQPIKFSHATHAGLQKIDCQYCHDGARRSKHSVIPAANTCMNCHKAIKKGSQYGTAELSKIFASVGYDPNTDKYIDNYMEMSEDEIEKIFKGWIEANYLADNELDALDREGERTVQNQWDDIVTSLTNDQKKTIGGPIEWTRIHNLPDHAYFNHAQHVSVGKIECQQCHGPIEEMEVVQQYAPLSMGWCVNCHRQTKVQFTENDYYQSYEKYHQEIKEGTRDGVTVEEIGGLECQKCHY